MNELSPPLLYDLGLGAAVQKLAERMQETHGLGVEHRVDADDVPLDDDLRAYLYNAVRELLINVVKHAHATRASVVIARSGSELSIAVQDNGTGIESSALHARPTEAGGFGLFHLQERLSGLGGRLEVESSPGRGTVIRLIVPVDDAPVPLAERATGADREAPPGVGGRSQEERTGKIRVMLADDHKLVREGFAGLLRGQPDIEVVGEAEDGEEAVEMARRLKPDVILMDVSMPRLNGLQATRTILAELPTVRVIGLSMHAEDDVAGRMRDAGAAEYMSKGVPAEKMLKAIRKSRDLSTIGQGVDLRPH